MSLQAAFAIQSVASIKKNQILLFKTSFRGLPRSHPSRANTHLEGLAPIPGITGTGSLGSTAFWCTIKIFRERGSGVMDGMGGNSERGLKWSGGSVRNVQQKHLEINRRWLKAKFAFRGEGITEGVTTANPHEKFDHTSSQECRRTIRLRNRLGGWFFSRSISLGLFG